MSRDPDVWRARPKRKRFRLDEPRTYLSQRQLVERSVAVSVLIEKDMAARGFSGGHGFGSFACPFCYRGVLHYDISRAEGLRYVLCSRGCYKFEK